MRGQGCRVHRRAASPCLALPSNLPDSPEWHNRRGCLRGASGDSTSGDRPAIRLLSLSSSVVDDFEVTGTDVACAIFPELS